MSLLGRLQLPLDQCESLLLAAHPPWGTPLTAQLTLADGDVVLGLTGRFPAAPTYHLVIAAAWRSEVLRVFAPVVDRHGRIRLRPCLAVAGLSESAVILDLWPRSVSPTAQIGPTPRRRGQTSPKVAAAFMLLSPLPALADTTYPDVTGISHPDESGPSLGRILTPVAPPPLALQAAVASPSRVIVRRGDTLYGLARRYLGSGAKWPQLWQLVRQRVRSPRTLPIGLAIDLPGRLASAPTPRLAQAPVIRPLPIAPIAAASALPPAVTDRVTTVPSPLPAIASPVPEVPARPAAPPPPTAGVIAPIPARLPIPGIPRQRPFGTRLGLSYNPVSYTEALPLQQVTARGTILKSIGGEVAWRGNDHVEVAAAYLFNGYNLNRGTSGPDSRTEHHGRLMAYGVWPVLPNLELAAGIGGQVGAYGVAVAPANGRPSDLYDFAYQRVMVQTEAKVGYQPLATVPLTVLAGIGAMPYGQGFAAKPSFPRQLWGIGWMAGVRYSLGPVAVETSYRGQRIFGDDYGQTADMVQAGVGYHFR